MPTSASNRPLLLLATCVAALALPLFGAAEKPAGKPATPAQAPASAPAAPASPIPAPAPAPAALPPVPVADLPKAFVDGTGLGWVALTFDDFVKVNCKPETWSEKEGVIHCTGHPSGVVRSKKVYTNFEVVAQWQHKTAGGNSGFFVWASEKSIATLTGGKGVYPQGIEVQVLDHGYAAQYEKQFNKKSDWFTTHGDVFPVGGARMTPFPPVAPGNRSFPRKNVSKGKGEWNHYYIRAINGEIRLWVNGEEVSGGSNIEPRTGHFCLESEGAPVMFKDIRLRELP